MGLVLVNKLFVFLLSIYISAYIEAGESLYSLREVNMDGMDILHVEITMLVEVEIFSPCLLIQTIKDVY